jgi:hypothetical protein
MKQIGLECHRSCFCCQIKKKGQHSHALCLKEQAQIEFNQYRPVVAEATCHSLSPIAKFCRCKVMPIVDVKDGFVELA